MRHRLWGSWVTLRFVQRGALLLLALLAGGVHIGRQEASQDGAAFVRETVQRWCANHGQRDDLQAVEIDVHFRAEPPLFTPGEGVVVVPIALELTGAQRVLDVASQPAIVRRLNAGGITALAWDYAGRVHRDMRFTGVALVERRPYARPARLEHPTFDALPVELRPDALARAAALEEHDLHKCAQFADWVRNAAGSPPYPDQVLRLVRAASARVGGREKEPEDVCAALRDGRFKPHWAQVAVVMGARELGIPAFGFAEASGRPFLVGTYTDQEGWILADVERPNEGWTSGGPPLVTMAPLLGAFSASQHGFWYPQAAAYANQGWGGVSALSMTQWRDASAPGKEPTDATEARSLRLSEVCR
jgi:hypothetical protein